MFSYQKFAKDFLEINNIAIETAILGPNEKIHDAITRTKGSFRQMVRGVQNIMKYKRGLQELEIRAILIKQNYKLIGKILKFVHENFLGIDRMVIIFPEPEGLCGKHYDTRGVTYRQVRKVIVPMMERWKHKFKDIRLYHFPLCTIDPKLWGHTWVTQKREEVDYLPICDKCPYKKYCCGIHKGYLKIIGKEEFKPPKTDLKFQTENNPCHPIVGIL
jgi:MoaA/NifB/PqqE/SkfB family radical SAM enzyme